MHSITGFVRYEDHDFTYLGFKYDIEQLISEGYLIELKYQQKENFQIHQKDYVKEVLNFDKIKSQKKNNAAENDPISILYPVNMDEDTCIELIGSKSKYN